MHACLPSVLSHLDQRMLAPGHASSRHCFRLACMYAYLILRTLSLYVRHVPGAGSLAAQSAPHAAPAPAKAPALSSSSRLAAAPAMDDDEDEFIDPGGSLGTLRLSDFKLREIMLTLS